MEQPAFYRSLLCLLRTTTLLVVMFCSSMLSAAVISHDIGSGNLIIPGNSSDDYVITGSTENHFVEVRLGYHGTITLQNCIFNFNGSGVNSPIRIVGKDGQPNDNPLTIVNLVLDGENKIMNNGHGRACIQVDQGAQINISAINPCDNNSGILVARQRSDDGGAAIGSLNEDFNCNEPTATAPLYSEDGTLTGNVGTTAGGNVVISSGTITARGGHGAGIGGGFYTYYDGMIVVYGGIVDASAIRHAAGIGSGCPTGDGVIQIFAPHSAVIALPPSVITAKGAVVGWESPELGLAGTKVRVYIGDPNMTNCPIHVYTEDHTPNADIYVDLSQDPDIYRVVTATVDPDLLDIHQVYFGTTDDNGVCSTTGKLQNNTTFFTDAISVSPSSYGHPYLPKVVTLPTGGDVELQRLMADFKIETFSSYPLESGYTSADAREHATCVKIVYNDASPIENVEFDLANGEATDFDGLIFLAADSSTVISAPTTLTRGDTYYIIVPLKTGQGAYYFSDVLRIIGVWQGSSTSYIRQIVSQVVGDIHTETICAGESYWFDGVELTEEGVYTNVTTTTIQCQSLSSVEILYLEVFPSPVISLDLTECDKYVWNDIEYTVSGQYEQLFQTHLGCDSLVIVDLDMEYTPKFQIEGDHYPIAGTEEAFTLYEYEIEMENPQSGIDSVSWSLGCQNGFDLQPIEGGMKAKLYIYAYSADSIEIKARVFNRCSVEEYSFWFHTSYYGLEEEGVHAMFDVFPNPGTGEFEICFHDMKGTVGLRVADLMGVVVMEKDVNCELEKQYVDLDLKGLPPGVYIVNASYQGKTYFKKCIITNF